MAEIQHSPNTRAYDLFKAIVAAILLLIIIILLLLLLALAAAQLAGLL